VVFLFFSVRASAVVVRFGLATTIAGGYYATVNLMVFRRLLPQPPLPFLEAAFAYVGCVTIYFEIIRDTGSDAHLNAL
jgi:hypothetical protein